MMSLYWYVGQNTPKKIDIAVISKEIRVSPHISASNTQLELFLRGSYGSNPSTKKTDPLMDTIQKLVSHGRWLFGPAKRSPQWATLPVGRVCRNNSEELQILYVFFSGHVGMLFH